MEKTIEKNVTVEKKDDHNYFAKGGKRYPVGLHPVYDEIYNARKLKSEILNPGMVNNGIFSINISDKNGILWEMRKLQGDVAKDGTKTEFYSENGKQVQARIPHYEEKLQQLEERWKYYQQNQVNWGQRRPTTMPDHMMEEKLTFEAILDIARFELWKLENLLKTFTDEEKKEKNRQMLQFGLTCMGKLSAGFLQEIDGQRVSQINGLLIIDDEESPYDGMLTADYHDLAKQWRQERIARRKALTEQYKKEMRETGESKIRLMPEYGMSTIKKENLPPWPVGIKNYKADSDSV